jgi:hypothetical protein
MAFALVAQRRTPLKNQRGQFIIEAVLMMIVFMGILALVTSWFRSQGVLGQLVQTPWTNLAGMLQNGEWAARDKGTIYHPSQHNRHITIQGDSPAGGSNGAFYLNGLTP